MATRNARTGSGGQRLTLSTAVAGASDWAAERSSERVARNRGDSDRSRATVIASPTPRRPLLLVDINDKMPILVLRSAGPPSRPSEHRTGGSSVARSPDRLSPHIARSRHVGGHAHAGGARLTRAPKRALAPAYQRVSTPAPGPTRSPHSGRRLRSSGRTAAA
jgi:hypothetical protein